MLPFADFGGEAGPASSERAAEKPLWAQVPLDAFAGTALRP